MRGPKHIRKASEESKASKVSKANNKHSSHSRRMSKILKESETSKASEASTANNSSQASYASIASPQISYYLKSASGAAKSAPRRPGDLLGDAYQILVSPGKNNNTVVAPLGPKIC